MLQASAFIGVFTGIAIAADFESGFGRRLLLAAANRLGIIAGYALGAAFRTIAIIILLQVVARRGCRWTAGPSTSAGYTRSRCSYPSVRRCSPPALPCCTRTVQSGPAMQIPVFLVLFLAPVYVPRELLSGWIETAAGVNPFTPIVEAGRDLVAGRAVDAGIAYGIALVLLAVTGVWAISGLRAAERAGG